MRMYHMLLCLLCACLLSAFCSCGVPASEENAPGESSESPSEGTTLSESTSSQEGPEQSEPELYTTDYPRVGTLPEGQNIIVDWAYMGETFDDSFAEADLTVELEILGLSDVRYHDEFTGVSVFAARLLKVHQNRTNTLWQEGDMIFLYQFGTPKYTYEGYPLFEPGARLLLHLDADERKTDHFSIQDGPFGVVRLLTYGEATYAVDGGLNRNYLQLTLSEEERKEIYDLLNQNPSLRLYSSFYPYESVAEHIKALCAENS